MAFKWGRERSFRMTCSDYNRERLFRRYEVIQGMPVYWCTACKKYLVAV